MEFIKVVETRTSVRNFTDEPVAESDLHEIIRLSSCAPCVGGSEFWKYIILTDRELLKKISDIVRDKYREFIPENDERITENVRYAVEKFASVIAAAPTVVVVVAEPYEALIDKVLAKAGLNHEDMNRMRNNPDILSIGGVVQTMLLAAVEFGYTGCWLSGPMIAREEVAKLLNITEPYSLASFVALGKPASNPLPRIKKPIDELILKL